MPPYTRGILSSADYKVLSKEPTKAQDIHNPAIDLVLNKLAGNDSKIREACNKICVFTIMQRRASKGLGGKLNEDDPHHAFCHLSQLELEGIHGEKLGSFFYDVCHGSPRIVALISLTLRYSLSVKEYKTLVQNIGALIDNKTPLHMEEVIQIEKALEIYKPELKIPEVLSLADNLFMQWGQSDLRPLALRQRVFGSEGNQQSPQPPPAGKITQIFRGLLRRK